MNHPPRITVVTPSFNQARFLERTICSVLDQGYDDLEYLVMDAGSCDGSHDILDMYEDELDHVRTDSFENPAEAINVALELATGDVIAFLGSDDLYQPFALHRVGELMGSDHRINWLVGQCCEIDAQDRPLDHPSLNAPKGLDQYLRSTVNALPQPACFWRRDLFEAHGEFDTSLRYHFDYEFNCRLLAAGLTPTVTEQSLAQRRRHATSRSHRDQIGANKERLDVIHDYTHRLSDSIRVTPANTGVRAA
jgi:glycosyltransferase involved in cell wall biosynthesis